MIIFKSSWIYNVGYINDIFRLVNIWFYIKANNVAIDYILSCDTYFVFKMLYSEPILLKIYYTFLISFFK